MAVMGFFKVCRCSRGTELEALPASQVRWRLAAGFRRRISIYWDGEEYPGVESPLGDFFGLGHGMLYPYISAPFVLGSPNALNGYWPMPYLKSARIEITNEGEKDIRCLYYIIDFREYHAPPKGVGLFHAKYRQEMPTTLGKNYKVFEASGRGHFVGLNMSIELDQDKWWGAGDAMIWVDGEDVFSVAGTAGLVSV